MSWAKPTAYVLATGLLLAGCATAPQGPSVMALPGSGKSFDDFMADDGVCRDWAQRQTGTTSAQAGATSMVTGAAVGTAVGAAAGAAIGAAAGNPAAGAAIGAGSGLLLGTAVGGSEAARTGTNVQQRYDYAYMQCMYAKGNQIPVARGSVRSYAVQPPYHQAPPPRSFTAVPPPPSGSPPAPPPGVVPPPPPAGAPPPPPPDAG
jgi:hypothetical protein